MQQKRSRALWSAITAITVVVTALVLGEPSADAAPRLPVTYNFLDGARAELAHPGGSLPGTNDFSCSPTPRHPRPVVLVHGSGGGRQTNWATMAPALANEGYCVFAPTYGTLSTQWPASALGGLGPKDDSAWQLKAFMSKVMTATHTDQIPESYRRYLVNGLRQDFDLPGTPIRLSFRDQGEKNPYKDKSNKRPTGALAKHKDRQKPKEG